MPIICIVLSSIVLGITLVNLYVNTKHQKCCLRCDYNNCLMDCPRNSGSGSGPRLNI